MSRCTHLDFSEGLSLTEKKAQRVVHKSGVTEGVSRLGERHGGHRGKTLKIPQGPCEQRRSDELVYIKICMPPWMEKSLHLEVSSFSSNDHIPEAGTGKWFSRVTQGSPLEHYICKSCFKIINRTSMVAQWLRIHLPKQGTWVQSLVREDSTCHGAIKPVCHSY